jgi:hypothetical protein
MKCWLLRSSSQQWPADAVCQAKLQATCKRHQCHNPHRPAHHLPGHTRTESALHPPTPSHCAMLTLCEAYLNSVKSKLATGAEYRWLLRATLCSQCYTQCQRITAHHTTTVERQPHLCQSTVNSIHNKQDPQTQKDRCSHDTKP